MPPKDAEQVRKEMKRVTEQFDALGRAAKAGQEFKKMQRELLGKLDPSSGIAPTPDYSDTKYDNQERAFRDALDECKRLLGA